MKRLSTLALTTMSLLLLEVVLLAGDAIAQQKSLRSSSLERGFTSQAPVPGRMAAKPTATICKAS